MFYINETKLRLNSFKSIREDWKFAIHAPENGILPKDSYAIWDKENNSYLFDHVLGFVVCEGITEAEETICRLEECREEELGLE